MQTNLEQVVNMIRELPLEDFEKLHKLIDQEERIKRQKEEPNQQIEQYKKARKWINENSDKYMNQWVCLEGDRLIAFGKDGLEVHREAKNLGIEIPFIHHIVDENLPFGGW